MTPPRRKGKLTEYQNGRYFMYVIEWDEVDERNRRHSEIEIHRDTEVEVYHVETRLLKYSTDIKEFDEIKTMFFTNPEYFER